MHFINKKIRLVDFCSALSKENMFFFNSWCGCSTFSIRTNFFKQAEIMHGIICRFKRFSSTIWPECSCWRTLRIIRYYCSVCIMSDAMLTQNGWNCVLWGYCNCWNPKVVHWLKDCASLSFQPMIIYWVWALFKLGGSILWICANSLNKLAKTQKRPWQRQLTAKSYQTVNFFSEFWFRRFISQT